MIDRLPLEQRESLLDVVRRREHKRGRSKPVTPEELMREILG